MKTDVMINRTSGITGIVLSLLSIYGYIVKPEKFMVETTSYSVFGQTGSNMINLAYIFGIFAIILIIYAYRKKIKKWF